jgi:hypothetical protein
VAVVLFAYEHVALFLKYFLHSSVSRVPASVQRDQERNRYLPLPSCPVLVLTLRRILSQKRKYESRLHDHQPKRPGDSEGNSNEARLSRPGPDAAAVTSIPSFRSFSLPRPESSPNLVDQPRSSRSRADSATLAADPFEFQSESGESPPPLNCLSEINFSQYDHSKRSLSPLFEILRLKDPPPQTHPPSLHPDLCDSSSSSSSESECYSHRSQGRYALPRSVNHYGGPGPVTFGSMNQLLRDGNSLQPRPKSESAAAGSRRESSQSASESVVSFDENDEECWRPQVLAQIDTLGSARKPLGPARIQPVATAAVAALEESPTDDSARSPTLRRCSTLDSMISSLTGPSTWTGHEEHSEHSSSRRASLLQAPLDCPPPKPIREFRKPSLGVQSTSPSLRRGFKGTTPPSNPRRSATAPQSPFQTPSPQSEATPRVLPWPPSVLAPSPSIATPPAASSPIASVSTSTPPPGASYHSPSAPLPQKPETRSPQLNPSPAAQITTSSSLPALPARPVGAKSRRTPQRRQVLSEERLPSPPQSPHLEPSPLAVESGGEERQGSGGEGEEPEGEELCLHGSENCENHFLASNAQSPQPQPLAAAALLPKRSAEAQLERPRLGAKRDKVERPRLKKPAGDKTEFSPKPAARVSRVPQSAQTKRNPVTAIAPASQRATGVTAEPKRTFQQRMESWLKQSDHSPEAPNPFLEVLKDR